MNCQCGGVLTMPVKYPREPTQQVRVRRCNACDKSFMTREVLWPVPVKYPPRNSKRGPPEKERAKNNRSYARLRAVADSMGITISELRRQRREQVQANRSPHT